jgi:hypothetical protein
LNEANPVPSRAERWASWMRARSRPTAVLLIGGCILVLAGAGWAAFSYLHRSEQTAELMIYRLCVGTNQALCPSDTTFVRNEGEDTLTRWTQRQCTGFRARRIIVGDAPSKDCACYVADVRCSTE